MHKLQLGRVGWFGDGLRLGASTAAAVLLAVTHSRWWALAALLAVGLSALNVVILRDATLAIRAERDIVDKRRQDMRAEIERELSRQGHAVSKSLQRRARDMERSNSG